MTESIHRPLVEGKMRNYNSVRGAEAYKADHQSKFHRKFSDRKERALLEEYFDVVGASDTILDLPCGHGRLSGFLKERCTNLVEGDWSFNMVELNQRDNGRDGRAYVRCSALEIPLPDRSVDTVVSFRLSHHLSTPELRERHLQELFRVARKAVIVTWFSSSSLKNVLRELRIKLGMAKGSKNTLANARVREVARACGFAQHTAKPLFVVGSGHVIGLFLRQQA